MLLIFRVGIIAFASANIPIGSITIPTSNQKSKLSNSITVAITKKHSCPRKERRRWPL